MAYTPKKGDKVKFPGPFEGSFNYGVVHGPGERPRGGIDPTTTSVAVVETRMGKTKTYYYQVPTKQLVKE